LSRAALLPLALALALAGCAMQARPPSLAPHYVVGEPYQASGVWRYPRERFSALIPAWPW